MSAFFFLADDQIRRLTCPSSGPLRLDARGRLAADGAEWVASVIPFAASERAPRRYAMVVAPDAGVSVGARHVTDGVHEIAHGDHVFFGQVEAIFSADALPTPVQHAPGDPCPICCERVGEGERSAVLSCPRCGARACNVCWMAFPRGVCATPGCGQPAALRRLLWTPRLDDFYTWEDRECLPAQPQG